ncbi:hypothetical protein FACS1894186_6250 [Alphaproteobacteria bacterium]|nr:hypothetical protein FACS1894186_6250 [Alphaproteobacteria bacterium]
MANPVSDILEKSPKRNLVNFVIGGPTVKNRRRKALAVDFMPTIIEAVGGRIEGGRLGLGVSLLRDEPPTLLESLDLDSLTEQMTSPSKLYRRLMGLPEQGRATP